MQQTKHYIKKLPQDLVNKIAAGEVIERPASVLKELLENSIDAKSTKIDVVIVQGGIEQIKVIDNGIGIAKEDLQLALTQHATSKISSMSELVKIMTLGFRGEALASIASIAKVNISSKHKDAELAWQIKDLDLSPTAQSTGTQITVQELFYNIPVRRKFLRTVNTEYQYLEQIFKAVVLSNFNVAFSIKHNQNKTKTYPACNNSLAMAKRVAAICGKNFIDNAIYFKAKEDGIEISGWLGTENSARAQTDLQYCYVNGRIVKDRLINHAIREAYRNGVDKMPLHKFPAYVLFLTIKPELVDVNVHPTKSEVRFINSRDVHSFIVSRVYQALTSSEITGLTIKHAAGSQHIISKNNIDNKIKNTNDLKDCDIKPLHILENQILLAIERHKLIVVDLFASTVALNTAILEQQQEKIASKQLLIPKKINLQGDYNLDNLGFTWTSIGPQSVLLRSIPVILKDSAIDLEYLINFLGTVEPNQQRSSLIIHASKIFGDFSLHDAKDLIAKLKKYKVKIASFSISQIQQQLLR